MQSWWIFLRPLLLEEAQRATAYNGETAADTAANILEGTEHCCRVQLFRQSLGKATATAAVAASSNQEVLREALETPMYSWKCSYFQGACRSFGPLARKTFGPNMGRTGKLLMIYDLIYGKSFARTRRLPTVRRMLVLFGSNFRPSTVDGRTDRTETEKLGKHPIPNSGTGFVRTCFEKWGMSVITLLETLVTTVRRML